MTDILETIVWDPSIYPRAKWSTSTIERYADALEAGDQFPPLVLERGTNRLLDGKHRLEAYVRRGILTEAKYIEIDGRKLKTYAQANGASVPVEHHTVPADITAKRYAARLSSRHGDRMSNADLKALAIEECEADPKTFDPKDFSKEMGVAERTVYDWVGHILSREKEERQGRVLRLSMLGWTQQEIASVLDVSQPTVSSDIKNCESAKADIQRLAEGHTERHEIARRFNLQPSLVEAVTLDGADDEHRMKKLGIKIQPYDVWSFPGCHDLMGDAHPGRIPGELVAHVLYFYTQPGDLVIDPMAGSGTTLDAALLMGRKARGYDIDQRHDRIDIEQHDLSEGWPETASKAALIFWDPPYYKKMDGSSAGHGGSDGYIEQSVSRLTAADYMSWFGERFMELRKTAKPGARLAFLMSDWDEENTKDPADHVGLFIWDYADLLRDAGWALTRHIQVPLPTQQIHPDIVTKFRQSRRLARLERYLLIATSDPK